MSELEILIAQKEELLKKIHDSSDAFEIIKNAIMKQRWFFFKNKDMIIFDRNTRLLWPNLCEYHLEIDVFDYDSAYYDCSYDNRYRVQARKREEVTKHVQEKMAHQKIDGYKNWRLPTTEEAMDILKNKSFPFCTDSHYIAKQYTGTKYPEGHKCYIISEDAEYYKYFRVGTAFSATHYFRVNNGVIDLIPWSRTFLSFKNRTTNTAGWIMCNDTISKSTLSYFNELSLNSDEYCAAIIKLFKENELIPIFDDADASIAFENFISIEEYNKKIYEIENSIKKIQEESERKNNFSLLPTEELLKDYDIDKIDSSIIKYYQAVQQWIEELLEKLDYYESEKETVIRDFNVIGLKLAKRYENSEHLTEEENTLLRDRQRYFASRFSLAMNSIKSKLLSVKHQADELEYRIDEIDNGDDAIHQLALLEKEERASFGFIAENTAKIIRNALKKIEFFEDNHQYVVWAVHAWEDWTESYRVFKTTYMEDLKGTCEEDGIEEEIWQKWYSDWQSVRFSIEEKVQPIIEKELRERIAMVEEGEVSVAQKIIAELEVYRDAIDTFYREERKGIYQNFAFQSNGDVQDKLETESKLYKLTAQFQSALQSIIFNCAKAEDRIYILNWANSLLDIQIDDILSLVADNDLQQISDTILTEFSELKQKNYEIYLADAKSYGEEQARRDKQFNSLLFKMRKGLAAK